MPKVTDEYLEDKKNFILKCTGKVLMEKPLYLITMRDIIKKAGFSQGVIYRYYENLDEIFIDFINKHNNNITLPQKIDKLLSMEQPEKLIIAECLITMGEFIGEMFKSVVGKTFFELTILYSYDVEKVTAIFPRLFFKQNIDCAQQKIVEYALLNLEREVFRPKLPVPSIINFINCSIDGIAQNAVRVFKANESEPEAVTIFISNMFQTLAQTVVGLLEV